MKIIAIGDPHGRLPKNLNEKMKDIDVIICVGDIPPVPIEVRKGLTQNFSKEFEKKADKAFKEVVDKLCSYNKPVFVLRGNMYLSKGKSKLTKKIFSRYKNLIYKKTGNIKILNHDFVLFDMSFEEHMYPNAGSWIKRQFKTNKKREAKLNRILKRTKEQIIISHAPPYSYLDLTKVGKRGSKILLRAIKKNKPRLVLCGHIHEGKGKARIGRTEVYNLGHNGDYKIITLKDDKK